MSDGSGEQQELTDEPIENKAETIQERVIRLYNSPNLIELALGYWMKVLYEAMVVGTGLLIPAFLASGLSYFGLIPITISHIWGLWGSLTVSIFAITWCFSEPSTSDTTNGDES